MQPQSNRTQPNLSEANRTHPNLKKNHFSPKRRLSTGRMHDVPEIFSAPAIRPQRWTTLCQFNTLPPIHPMKSASLSPEQVAALQQSNLYNDDLAPVPESAANGASGSFAALWISMSACIPTYMLASSLIGGGMNWWQAILTIFLGNLIVLIPMILNAHAGTRYGIPFPVYLPRRRSAPSARTSPRCCARSSPAAGSASRPGSAARRSTRSSRVFFRARIGLRSAQRPRHHLAAVRLLPLLLGRQHVGHLQGHRLASACCSNIKAPLLIALGLAPALVGLQNAGGFGPILSQPSAFDPGQPKAGQFWAFFFPALTGMIGFWATLSLNIPDFSRYANSQRDQIVGQALGLPLTMALYSFIGVAVTSATTIIYGTDDLGSGRRPDALQESRRARRRDARALHRHARDQHRRQRRQPGERFRPSRAAPDLLPHRRLHHRHHRHPDDAVETGRRSDRLHFHLARRLQRAARPDRRHHDRRLFRLRRRKLNVAALYDADGEYRYTGGFSIVALIALARSRVLPNLPGFLVTVKVLLDGTPSRPFFMTFYNYAWFVGFAIAFVLYLALRMIGPSPATASELPTSGVRRYKLRRF